MRNTGKSGSTATWRKLVGGAVCGAILSASATSWAAYTGSAPLLVANGGTGAQTFTAHGVLIGEGTSAISVTAVGTTGIPLVGVTGADPVFGTAVVGGGGTGATTLTNHGLLIGQGTSPIVATAAGTSSQVLTSGGGSADPGYVNLSTLLTAGTGISLSGTTNVTITATGSGGGVALTTATASGTSPITIAATNGLTTIVSMGTPAASTINLPTAVQTAGWRECVKDGTTNFATNNATIKSPTSGTIDGVAGSTGVVANQAHQELCFISDGTNWFIE